MKAVVQNEGAVMRGKETHIDPIPDVDHPFHDIAAARAHWQIESPPGLRVSRRWHKSKSAVHRLWICAIAFIENESRAVNRMKPVGSLPGLQSISCEETQSRCTEVGDVGEDAGKTACRHAKPLRQRCSIL